MKTRNFTYMEDESFNIPDEVFERWPFKASSVYEEEGVGLVGYYVLSCDYPKKIIANHLLKANPRLCKIYMALRDDVCYNLERDINCGRNVKEYKRNSKNKSFL